jgi:hypothetical protein
MLELLPILLGLPYLGGSTTLQNTVIPDGPVRTVNESSTQKAKPAAPPDP